MGFGSSLEANRLLFDRQEIGDWPAFLRSFIVKNNLRALKLLIIIAVIPILGAGQNQLKDQDVQRLANTIRTGSTSQSLEAILAAGRSRNKKYVPLLRSIAESESISYAVKTVPSYAKIALAMLGDEGFLALILQEIDSEDIALQNTGIEKLSLVGGRAAFKTFFHLLDDTSARREMPSEEEKESARARGFVLRKGDEIFEPRSIVVMRKLSTMVIDPRIPPGTDPTLNDVKIWKNWFQRHLDLIR